MGCERFVGAAGWDLTVGKEVFLGCGVGSINGAVVLPMEL